MVLPLHKLQEFSKRSYVPADAIDKVYTGPNQRQQLFEWLDKAYVERSPWLVNLNVDPMFDVLRPDPRFRELVQRVGLP